MTSMGLRASNPLVRQRAQPQGDGAELMPGEKAVVHPPAVMNPKAPLKPQQGDIIRDLLHRLNQQPQRVAPMPEQPQQEDLKSVLRR